MSTDLDERVRALERALTESDEPPVPISAVSDVSSAVADLDDRVADLESRVADLAARQQAVEAYVDRIDHVDDTIGRRADAALAAVDRLESSLQREPPAARPSESDTTAGRDSSQQAPNTDPTHPSHVTDAARTAADSDGEADALSESLLARIIGL